MRSQKSRGVAPSSPSRQRKSRFTLRGRKKKDRVIRGKLRIRSVPGAFLVLGVLVVVVGTALAVAGYWPYRMTGSSILGGGEGKRIAESQTGWSLRAKGLLSTSALIHSDRMKLLGPVIMGVGLFILICANTVLYENRDRETQMLLAQMRSVICSVSAAVPSADLKDMAVANSMARHYQWVGSLPAAHLNILCVPQLASSEPLLQTGRAGDRKSGAERIYRQTVLRTEALHHQESQTPPSVHSGSCNSSRTDVDAELAAEREPDPDSRPVPLVTLSDCLVSACSMSTLEVDEVDISAAQPRRCHSMSYRTNPYVARTVRRPEESVHISAEDGRSPQQDVAGRDPSSRVHVDIPGQVADPVEEQTRGSWPRLDLGGGRRYLKLENKEDSVDKLLDRLGQQSSQWDRSFGSGPFQ